MTTAKPWQVKNDGQVLCGPFARGELPDFQAACVHFDQQWSRFLSATEAEFVKAIIYRTARTGRYIRRKMPMQWFFNGHLGSTKTGYAGCPSMLPISRTMFHRVRNDLVAYGIVNYTDDHYAIDYSVNAIHLARNEKVQKRLLSQHRGGGLFKTIEGINQWANHCANLLTQTSIAAPEKNQEEYGQESNSYGSVIAMNGKPVTSSEYPTENQSQTPTDHLGGNCSKTIQTNKPSKPLCENPKKRHNRLGVGHNTKCKPYRLTHKTHVILSSDKSSDNKEKDITDLPTKADAILAAVSKSVDTQRAALDSKRRKRRTLADECSLFEKAWLRGQEGRGRFVNRIVGRDRRYLKEQIVKPSQGSDLDLEALAEWCTQHWQAIGAQHFAKAKSYPEYPAIRWFIKCFAAYLEAFEQKDYLDEAGTRSTAQLVKRARLVDKQDDETIETLSKAQREIALLKAELRDANKRAASKTSEPIDDFDRELRGIVGKRKIRKGR